MEIRQATEKDLWNGQIVISWVRKPTSYNPNYIISSIGLEVILFTLEKFFGGKFDMRIETDSHETVIF